MDGTPDERHFTVGVAARGGVRGGGTLTIRSGRLECQLGRASRSVSGVERIRHEGMTVDVYRARLVPFWFNVSVVIDDGHAAMLASKSAFGLRGLEATLTEARFPRAGTPHLDISRSPLPRDPGGPKAQPLVAAQGSFRNTGAPDRATVGTNGGRAAPPGHTRREGGDTRPKIRLSACGSESRRRNHGRAEAMRGTRSRMTFRIPLRRVSQCPRRSRGGRTCRRRSVRRTRRASEGQASPTR